MTNFLNPEDIRLDCTCGACPEQYDAYDPDGNCIGYLRLRHGHFRVHMDGPGGVVVFSAQTEGDGLFDYDERDRYLRLARKALARYINRRGEAMSEENDESVLDQWERDNA